MSTLYDITKWQRLNFNDPQINSWSSKGDGSNKKDTNPYEIHQTVSETGGQNYIDAWYSLGLNAIQTGGEAGYNVIRGPMSSDTSAYATQQAGTKGYNWMEGGKARFTQVKQTVGDKGKNDYEGVLNENATENVTQTAGNDGQNNIHALNGKNITVSQQTGTDTSVYSGDTPIKEAGITVDPFNFGNSFNKYIGTDNKEAHENITQTAGIGSRNYIKTGTGYTEATQTGDYTIHEVDASASTRGVTATQEGDVAGKNFTGSNVGDNFTAKGSHSNFETALNGGDDTAEVFGVHNTGTIDGGTGDDQLKVHSANQNGLRVDGGAGEDTVYFDKDRDQYDITFDETRNAYQVREKRLPVNDPDNQVPEGVYVSNVENWNFAGNTYTTDQLNNNENPTESTTENNSESAPENNTDNSVVPQQPTANQT